MAIKEKEENKGRYRNWNTNAQTDRQTDTQTYARTDKMRRPLPPCERREKPKVLGASCICSTTTRDGYFFLYRLVSFSVVIVLECGI